MNNSLFDYDTFVSLSGSELVEYTEPFINEFPGQIDASCLGLILRDLATLDCLHIVYAIEIASLLSPSQFAIHAAKFLAHPDASVCSTAFRVLNKLEKHQFDDRLVEMVRSTPIVTLYGPNPVSNEPRSFGTNKPFVEELSHSLLARLAN